VHLFSLDFLNQYERAVEDPLATDVVERWNIRYLLLNKSNANLKGRRSIEDSGAWSKIYEDRVSVLFEKRIR